MNEIGFGELTDVVFLSTAKKMKKAGFSPPDPGVGQVWETDTGEIINLCLRDWKQTLHGRILSGSLLNEGTTIPPLVTFLPRGEYDIKPDLEASLGCFWHSKCSEFEEYCYCYSENEPEKHYTGKTVHEAYANAWLALNEKPKE